MNVEINFELMSDSEKLRIMELSWDDLCHSEPDIPPPQWNESVLVERENLIRDSRDVFVDCDQAKKEMKKKTS
jgi:hypothetical protein